MTRRGTAAKLFALRQCEAPTFYWDTLGLIRAASLDSEADPDASSSDVLMQTLAVQGSARAIVHSVLVDEAWGHRPNTERDA